MSEADSTEQNRTVRFAGSRRDVSCVALRATDYRKSIRDPIFFPNRTVSTGATSTRGVYNHLVVNI